MTGFLNRFFGRKPEDSGSEGKSNPKPEPKPQSEPKPKTEKGSFFLNPDEAKTFGNIDYMRTPVTVRKTFMQGAAEIVEQISATEKITLSESSKSASSEPSAKSTPDSATPIPPVTERRRSGSDLDAFRKMARDIKRGE